MVPPDFSRTRWPFREGFFYAKGKVKTSMAVVWAEDDAGDQDLIRSVVEDLPEAPGIRFASDGVQALAEIRRRRPRLVVLDVNMPNLNGIEALRRLRASPEGKDVSVVVFSTARNDEEVAACQQLGVVAFLQKPFQFQEFTKAVHAIIELAGPKARLPIAQS